MHTKGHVEATSSNGGYKDVLRSFKTCAKYGAIAVGFSKTPGTELREDSKSGFFE